MIRPGVSCREVYRAFIDKLTRMELAPISFVGYGIGLHLDEETYLQQPGSSVGDVDQTIDEGMVFSAMPRHRTATATGCS
jgi:Xaa-Pro aminopeptidase